MIMYVCLSVRPYVRLFVTMCIVAKRTSCSRSVWTSGKCSKCASALLGTWFKNWFYNFQPHTPTIYALKPPPQNI